MSKGMSGGSWITMTGTQEWVHIWASSARISNSWWMSGRSDELRHSLHAKRHWKLFVYMNFSFFTMPHGLRDLSSPMRDWTRTLGSESMESWPLDCPRISYVNLLSLKSTPWGSRYYYPHFFNIFFDMHTLLYLFTFGCAGSSLLHTGFL